ncbi:hypothetical protein KFU94_33785 [Chloroflexi bacterium TSY]|nr:hypothetical protein [Chloroflexi bacterium TSY]
MSDLSKRPGEVLALMENGPVLLLSRSTPAGLLVRPEDWNRIVEELRRHRILEEARRIEAQTNAGDSWIPWEQTKARMKAHAGVED